MVILFVSLAVIERDGKRAAGGNNKLQAMLVSMSSTALPPGTSYTQYTLLTSKGTFRSCSATVRFPLGSHTLGKSIMVPSMMVRILQLVLLLHIWVCTEDGSSKPLGLVTQGIQVAPLSP